MRWPNSMPISTAVAGSMPRRSNIASRCASNPDGTETWTVRNAHAPKVKSNHPSVAFRGEQTEKLVDLFRTDWRHEGLLFKFKLEVGLGADDLIRIGDAGRRASGADYLVANTLEMVDGTGAGAYLLSDTPPEFIPRAALATRLAEMVRARLAR